MLILLMLAFILQVPEHLERPAKTQLQKIQRQQVKPFMTFDNQIVSQTLQQSHPPTPSSELLEKHGHLSPESDPGLTGNTHTKLLTLGKEDDRAEWHVCLIAAYEYMSVYDQILEKRTQRN